MMTSSAKTTLLAGGICAALVAPAPASEWSVQPAIALWGDHDSNRLLREGTPPSEAITAVVDLRLARRTETSEILVLPHLLVQRYSDDVTPNIEDKRLALITRWDFERSQLQFNGDIADESTLTTELSETGLVSADATRRRAGGNFAWLFAHAPSRQLSVSLVHSNVDYMGGYEDQLFDYRYSALSVGESFGLSERLALTTTANATQLLSPDRDSESREGAASAGIDFEWNERISLMASLGLSLRNIDGVESSGTTGDLSLTRVGETRDWRLVLSHGLEPYGTGVLSERSSGSFIFTQHFSSRLQAGMKLEVSINRDAGSGVTIDSRKYRAGDLELLWRVHETWNVTAAVGVASANELNVTDGRVDGWSFQLRSSWTPSPRVIRQRVQ